MSGKPEIVMVVEATEAHPRHSCGDMVELKDGSLFMAKMEIFKSSDLRHAADDEAKSDIVGIVSRDGGRTWGDHRTLIKCGANDTAAYYPRPASPEKWRHPVPTCHVPSFRVRRPAKSFRICMQKSGRVPDIF